MSTLKSSAEDLTLNADGSGNDVIIQSNGSTKAIVTAEGNIGIGDTDPSEAKLSIDNVASGDKGLQIVQAQDEYGLFIDQNGNKQALYIDCESAGEYAIKANSKWGIGITQDISGGSAATFNRDIAEAGSYPLVNIIDDNASNTQPALKIQQDGAGIGLQIDQNGDDRALYIDSESTNSNAIKAHGKYPIQCIQDLSGGYAANFNRNLAEAGSEPLVTINDNHTSNTQPALYVKQDGNAEALYSLNTNGQAAKIWSDTNDSNELGMSVIAGADSPSSSGDCKWIRLADGDDSGKAYIQFKSSSPNAEFAAISDERLKTNIENTDVVGLDVINKLRLIKFDWNETATQDAGWSMKGHQKLGFIAQEVEQIVPEFISEDVNGFKIMGDSGFVLYLIKAVQEQQTQIEELEARITTLENA